VAVRIQLFEISPNVLERFPRSPLFHTPLPPRESTTFLENRYAKPVPLHNDVRTQEVTHTVDAMTYTLLSSLETENFPISEI